MCITDLGVGEKGVITSVDTSNIDVQRLMVMGLVEGAEIIHLTTAGNSFEFRIMGSIIAFSKEQAQHFTVEPA